MRWLLVPVGVASGLAHRMLLIDCHDSYTQNVAAWLASASRDVCGATTASIRDFWPTVIPHDDADLVAALRNDPLYLRQWDAVVLSPGPGHPAVSSDFAETAAGLALEAAPPELPILGVCLGHQGLAWASGLDIKRMARPRHGIVDAVRHDGTGLFQDLPQGFGATRYHSLTVCDANAEASGFRVTARSHSGDVLGIAHESLPRVGVQFHPESVATHHGALIARNFLRQYCGRSGIAPTSRPIQSPKRAPTGWRLDVKEVPVDFGRDDDGRDDDGLVSSAYRTLFAGDSSVWIDGASDGVSIIAGLGPRGFALTHDAATTATRFEFGDSSREVVGIPLLATLRAELDRRRPEPQALPFDFDLGFIGYLGYEMRKETMDYEPAESSPSSTPDAGLLFCDRAVVFDHGLRKAWALELLGEGDAPSFRVDPAEWVVAPEARRANLAGLEFRPDADADDYAVATRRALRRIACGDTYEVCLTTQFKASYEDGPAPLDLYETLRAHNPAPHSAFLDLRVGSLNVAVASSSPERFLKVRDDAVEAKPIKGTSPRASSPSADRASATRLKTGTKTKAENLMIADLLRNDLLRVCDDAHVEAFAELESFATVHQLVTTVAGTLQEGKDALDVLNATFPPGSMTGAPKRRTCQIIHDIERRRPRGCYSGTLGYLGLNGNADLNVVIRTAVFTTDSTSRRSTVTVGAGGALTALSSVSEEWDEMTLKADTVIAALGAKIADDKLRRLGGHFDEDKTPARGGGSGPTATTKAPSPPSLLRASSASPL